MAAGDYKKDMDELRTRIGVLERDNEMLMDIVMKISKIFEVSNNDKLEDIPIKKAIAIVRRVEKGDITTPQYETMMKISDVTAYADAVWFKKQIVVAFEKLFLNINKVKMQEMTFDEIKAHLEKISKMPKTGGAMDMKTYVYGLLVKPA